MQTHKCRSYIFACVFLSCSATTASTHTHTPCMAVSVFTYGWDGGVRSVGVDVSAVTSQLIQEHGHILVIHQLHQHLQNTSASAWLLLSTVVVVMLLLVLLVDSGCGYSSDLLLCSCPAGGQQRGQHRGRLVVSGVSYTLWAFLFKRKVKASCDSTLCVLTIISI